MFSPGQRVVLGEGHPLLECHPSFFIVELEAGVLAAIVIVAAAAPRLFHAGVTGGGTHASSLGRWSGGEVGGGAGSLVSGDEPVGRDGDRLAEIGGRCHRVGGARPKQEVALGIFIIFNNIS